MQENGIALVWPRKQDNIRDAIYGYIEITPFEKEIIEDPYFQRLRFIYQNSSAYLTYPSNQLTRFSHSIGVMHVGSQMFSYGIGNAVDSVRNDFKNKCLEFVNYKINELDIKESLEELECYWKENENFYLKNGHVPAVVSHDFVFNIILQSVRLISLCHDIGHLPFSHIFEMALAEVDSRTNNDYSQKLIAKCKEAVENAFSNIKLKDIKEATELHELIGASLLCELFNKVAIKRDRYGSIFKLCMGIAIEIFVHEKRDYDKTYLHKKFISALYPIVSSELDADRIDYILRDARASSLELGNFDFTRIFKDYRLFFFKEDDVFGFIPSDKSISSIDQFFNYRYLMYEYVYYHHNVAKYDGLIIEILVQLLENLGSNNCHPTLKEKCINSFRLIDEDFNIFPMHIDSRFCYEYYDDCWLRSLFQELYLLGNSTDGLFKENETINLLGTFLYRRKVNAISWAKNSVQIDGHLSGEYFNSLIDTDNVFRYKYSLLYGSNESKEEKHRVIRDLFGGYSEEISESEITHLRIKIINESKDGSIPLILGEETRKYFRELLNDPVKKSLSTFIDSELVKLRDELRRKGVFLILKKTPPKLQSNKQMILVNGGTKKLEEASFYLANLKNIAQTHFHYYFGFYKPGIGNDDDSIDLTTYCSKKVSEFLFHLLDEILFYKIYTIASMQVKLNSKK